MNEELTPLANETAAPTQTDASVQPSEKAPVDRTAPRPRRKHQKPVVQYIAILFAAAFLLLGLTFFMERRQSAQTIDHLNESISGLKESVSAMQSVEGLYAENEALKAKVTELEAENEVLKAQTTQQTESLSAMDWFWQIDEAYAKGRYSLCRTLINSLDDTGLTDALPTESTTDTGRFSPADRLAEIRNNVF